ncbi:copper resistance protein CopB [Ameyamaea chiangmaiensis NBRC 103196]|nr:copper resistance protein CopB [Ameyamaea chiangmaiensis NBRC 103196]
MLWAACTLWPMVAQAAPMAGMAMDDMPGMTMPMPAPPVRPPASVSHGVPAKAIVHRHAAPTSRPAITTPGTVPSAGIMTMPEAAPVVSAPVHYVSGVMPVMDHGIYAHAILEQLEARYAPSGTQFRYDGQAWVGTDYNRLWLKSEGTLGSTGFHDGDHELFYDRPISTYFDVQAGVRADIDDGPSRVWGAFGVEGLALYFFELGATFYVSGDGRVAGKLEGSYDLMLTNRLILQPQAELNFYSRRDPGRGVASGLSDIDTGLRLRYDISRSFSPYVAVTYDGQFGRSGAVLRPDERQARDTVRFTVGLRTWF